MVGILLSFWDSLFSGAILVLGCFRECTHHETPHQHEIIHIIIPKNLMEEWFLLDTHNIPSLGLQNSIGCCSKPLMNQMDIMP